MNRTFSRLLALAGSAAVGLTGALAFGAPAQAHHATITAGTECVEHQWVVTWTVTNSQARVDAKLTAVKATPGTTLTKIVVDAPLPKGGSVVGVQKVAADVTSATLSVSALWTNGNKDDDTKTITLDPRECVSPSPSPSPSPPAPSPSASKTAPATPVPSPSTPGLPVTGTQVTSIAFAGLLLMAGGIAVFLIARRRRVNLTDIE